MKCRDAYESHFELPKIYIYIIGYKMHRYTLCCAYKAYVHNPIYIYWNYTVNPLCNIYIIQKENPIYRIK